jgi:hypothetical protein
MGMSSTAGLTAGIFAAALLTASCAADSNSIGTATTCLGAWQRSTGPDPRAG